jgi:hypothetical protein
MTKRRSWVLVLGLLTTLGGSIRPGTAQTTIDGTVSNAAASSPVTNATVAFWLDERTNWVAGVDDASDGWTVVHANGTTTGTYTRTFATSPTNVDMAVLAIGYQRGAAKLDPPSPVATQTRRFELTPGTLRLETETDADVTCQEHGYGGRPRINWDPSCSSNRNLTLAHYWTHMKTPLYFPRAAEYNFTLRYTAQSGAGVWLLPTGWHPAQRIWWGTGNVWTTMTQTVLIDTAGWYNDFAIRAQNLGYGMNEYVDYLEITEGSPLLSATITGSTTTNGAALPYVEVIGIRDESTNWPGSVFYADGTAGGAYSLPASAVRSLQLTALAIGYQRATNSVAPVASGNRDFALTPGTLRVEAESDPRIVYESHDEGWRPFIVTNGSASGGNFLGLSHNNTHLYLRLYFGVRGEYGVPLRYYLASGASIMLKLDTATKFTWPAAASWTTSNGTMVVDTVGWHDIEIYATSVPKSWNSAGIDYAEFVLNKAYVTGTITGTVRNAGGPMPNVRVAGLVDNAAGSYGSAVFANTDANGNYSITLTGSDSITLCVQAPGYHRDTATIAPIANAARDFYLAPGALYLEAETDTEVTYDHHSEGYIPSVGADATCSQGKYLIYPHYWGRARATLYFPKTDVYKFQARYKNRAASANIQVDGGVVWTLPATANVWVKTNAMISVTAGWRNVDMYAVNLDKAFPGVEGFDYLRIGENPDGLLMLVR